MECSRFQRGVTKRGKPLFARGQAANEAWVLIGLITLVLIFYILFLPPAERHKLLEDGPGISTVTLPGGLNATLFQDHIGTLDAHEPVIAHAIPSSRVFESKKAVILEEFNPFFVRRGWFGRRLQNLTFEIPDVENTDNVLLAFEAPVRSGVLAVSLNGRVVFESPVSRTPSPIRLRKEHLDKSNSLEFSVSGVGFAFWRSNEIQIQNAKVVADVTDVSRQKAQNVFAVSPAEKNNVLIATLDYTADCDDTLVGPLTILINDQRVFGGVPDCGGPNRIEVPGQILQEGANTMHFQTTRGDYFLSSMRLTTILRKTRSYVAYVDVPKQVVDRARTNAVRVMLEIDFVDDKKPKVADVNINGHITRIDQNEPFYARNLNAFVLPGSRNYIEITPVSSINIPELRVVVR
ncbi:hypothetical protein HY641_02515 [Candidatus Woesearchaeota archaeon]|nr:hypothetical protein [Candidatus Woesearchaeota archaeon]